MKLIFAFLLFLSLLSNNVHALANVDLQEDGRQLANYQACAAVAKRINDLALQHYYEEMFEDSASDIRYYPLNESEVVYRTFFKSVKLLKKVAPASMEAICLSRFDALSRKMQEKKLYSLD
ncbi:hypothetical protein [Psychromonas sp. MME2]|uniref:hypothetical protein n=1 Tax=unclassified Psychromonas TaxID=2614957 RepID=UPI00339C9777